MVVSAKEVKPLFVPSHPNYRDMLRTVKSLEGVQAILLYPLGQGYICRDRHLYKDGIQLNEDDLHSLVKSNREIRDPVMIYGIFSFFDFKGDIRNRDYIECTVTELYHYLELNMGKKGNPLLETLMSYESVVGWISRKGVFPVLRLDKLPNGSLRLTSEYFHQVLKVLPEKSALPSEQEINYRLASIPLSILRQRSKQAALVALEFAYLLETMGSDKGQGVISIRELLRRVPDFGEVLQDESKSISYRNRHLRNVLKGATIMLRTLSDLPNRYPRMAIRWSDQLSVRDDRLLVMLWRNHPEGKGDSKI